MKICSIKSQNFCGYDSVSSSFLAQQKSPEVYVLTTKLNNEGIDDLDRVFKNFPDLYKSDNFLSMTVVSDGIPDTRSAKSMLKINDKTVFHEAGGRFILDLPEKTALSLASYCGQILDRMVTDFNKEPNMAKSLDSPKSFAQTIRYISGVCPTQDIIINMSKYVFNVYNQMGIKADIFSAEQISKFIDNCVRKII